MDNNTPTYASKLILNNIYIIADTKTDIDNMLDEYENEEEQRQHCRILNLMPVALRGSQRGVHPVCYFGPIRPFVVPFIAGTKTKMADFSPKYTAIFPPNKPFVTFSSPYVTFFSSL